MEKEEKEEEKEEKKEKKRRKKRRRRGKAEEEIKKEIFIPLNLTEVEVNQYLNTMKALKNVDVYFELDVSNKNLTNVSVIPRFFKFLRHVNVSENRLTSEALRVLEEMDLVELRADKNWLTTAKLNPMKFLETLTMNNNKLTSANTDDISHEQLTKLELKENLISTVEFMNEKLPKLLKLELSGNALTTMAGKMKSTSEHLISLLLKGIFSSTLTELYLDKNKIENIENLRELPNLTKLSLESNQIENLNGLSMQCLKLEYINLGDNNISKVSEFVKLSCLPCLKKLIILKNPFLEIILEDEEGKRYRLIVLMMLPNLIKIDNIPVKDEEKIKAKELLDETHERGYGFKNYDLEKFAFRN
ncbi:leucine-rich repeat-containing protein 23-like [Cataglyphis hispanica]|uniref:leucine-rich repeat-containing protein 23-like n=1 Tax=Cataglyphis hispanica TaxID=1086592 RepID=UPI00217FDEFD|nr:leucine-rich repeat-containing protein 23-like [Cataglyphis hispanica]